jgi:uncharacterized membrane protein
MALSDQLHRLATRAKEAEDRAAAAREKARTDLEHDVKAARDASQANAQALRDSAETSQAELSAWWTDVARSWGQHVAAVRERIDEKKAAHDLKSAQRDAELSDEDASYAIDYAYAAVEEAEYAVLDAALAHKYADDLAAEMRAS